MKYLSVLLVILFALGANTGVQAQEQAIADYFAKYEDNEDFTSVYISARLFTMFAKVDVEMDEDVKEVIKDLKGLRILTTDALDGTQLYKEAMKKINTAPYDLLMSVKDDGQNVKFYVKEKGDIINELLLLVGGEDDFVLMSFLGNIDIEKISKLSETMDIENLEHLEKIENKQ